jgi:hypothetical protein
MNKNKDIGVFIKNGSINTTEMPDGRNSCRREIENPSTPNLDAA